MLSMLFRWYVRDMLLRSLYIKLHFEKMFM